MGYDMLLEFEFTEGAAFLNNPAFRDEEYVNRVKARKSALEMAAFSSCTRFAMFAEDKELRNTQKWARYDACRVIQWDTNNCPAPEFVDASLYRATATFSQYYSITA
jgi:hypothetical protein